jgi:hypothetical protein
MIAGEPVRGRYYRLHRELLHAMERARSRLAVAIASENKVTPRGHWQHYLETEDRMRLCVREIRRHPNDLMGGRFGWVQALDLLKQPLPAADQKSRGEAQRLCQRLSEVLCIIEKRGQGG